MSKANKKFDIDLRFGQVGESELRKLLGGEFTVEVKSEREEWKNSGNIAFEVRFRKNLSGIAGTKADWWAHRLTSNGKTIATLIFPTEALKSVLRKYNKGGKIRVVKGGDNNDSVLLLFPIAKLSQLINDIVKEYETVS